MNKFNRKDLLFNEMMDNFWNNNGYLILEDFYSNHECDELRDRADFLVKKFDPESFKSVFDTKKQEYKNDDYFLESGDKIRFFFENKAFDDHGHLTNKKKLVINKIGHALHDLDEVFYKFYHKDDLNKISKALNIKNPLLIQSMYIFKQLNIDGEVVCH